MSQNTLLKTYLRPYGRHLFLLTVLLLAGIGLQLTAPQIIRRFLDTAQSGAAAQTLILMGVVFLVVVVTQKAITLIDFPQMVDARKNPHAFDLLRRDITRVCDYYGRFGVLADPQQLTLDLWRPYMREG